MVKSAWSRHVADANECDHEDTVVTHVESVPPPMLERPRKGFTLAEKLGEVLDVCSPPAQRFGLLVFYTKHSEPSDEVMGKILNMNPDEIAAARSEIAASTIGWNASLRPVDE